MKRTGKVRCHVSPSQMAYAEHVIAHVQERRSRPFGEADLSRILAEQKGGR